VGVIGLRTIKLTIQYDGTNFAGFQRQPNGVTVQEKLEEALRSLLDDPTFKIGAAAGRTDAGVHARGQVVHIRTDATIPLDRWPYALNQRLPAEIVAVGAEAVPDEFHARYWAERKRYVYSFYHAPFPSPLSRLYAYHWGRELDLAKMQAAAELLTGTHDFAAFRSSGGAAKTSTRTVYRLDLAREGALVQMGIEADGFLYNMVRIIAGTLLEVGAGRRALADVATALRTGDRTKAGKTLPPHGLCLERVWYGNGPKRAPWETEDPAEME
jgi:tRNA pseudouridine38-40 synthase